MSTKLFLLLAIVSVNGQLQNNLPCITGYGLPAADNAAKPTAPALASAINLKKLDGLKFIEVQKFNNANEASYSCVQQTFKAADQTTLNYQRSATNGCTNTVVPLATGAYKSYDAATKTFSNVISSPTGYSPMSSSVIFVDDPTNPALLALYSCTPAGLGSYYHQMFVLSKTATPDAEQVKILNTALTNAKFTAQGISLLTNPEPKMFLCSA